MRFPTRRVVVLAVVLAVAALVMPPAAERHADTSLVKVQTAQAVDHPRDVVWVLCLGSDARPGQRLTGTRADAIQLVGLNLRTGAGTMIGIPRDSYVDIRGHGRNKINASMFFGGPQLMADSVGRMVGVRPDYVFTTGFLGFRGMVRAIGGVTVHSKFSFSDPVRPQGYHRGTNQLNPFQALIFGRVRHPLPRGRLRPVREPAGAAAQHPAQGARPRAAAGVHGARRDGVGEVHGHRPARPPSCTGSPRRSPGSSPASSRAAWCRGPPATSGERAWCSRAWRRPAGSATTPARTATLNHGC